MKKELLLLLVIGAILTISPLRSQTRPVERDWHLHAENEIGFGVSGAYEIDHHEWTTALHLHYFRTLSPHSRWAVGGGLEYLKGDERHLEIGVGARYEPVAHLHLTLVPGITITDKTRFSIHAEATYAILYIGRFHLGPLVGYAWSTDHSHLSIGLHAAVGF